MNKKNNMGKAMGKLFFKNGSDELKNVPKSFFELTATDIRGNPVSFEDYRGKHKAYLVVNVACLCGLTYGNYKQLSSMYDRYQSEGLTVLAFPCNQFKNQEKDSEEDIEEFVKTKFNAKFQLFSKVDINGSNTHPVFKYLRTHSELHDPATGLTKEIPWNFAKFLLDKEGNVIKFFHPTVEPKNFETDVQKLLQQ
jgi:glutathione peroxidase